MLSGIFAGIEGLRRRLTSVGGLLTVKACDMHLKSPGELCKDY